MAVKLFSYRRGNTLLHRIPAGIKILFLMGISIAVFAGKHVNVSVTVICGALSLMAFFLSGAKFSTLKSVTFVFVLGAFVTLFSALVLLPHEGAVVFCSFAGIDPVGIKYGALYTVRFFITALAAQCVFETTSALEIQNSFECAQNAVAKVFKPVKKMNPALVLSLAINFIPEVFATWNRVDLAVRARSAAKGKNKFSLRILGVRLTAFFLCLLEHAESKRMAVLNRG